MRVNGLIKSSHSTSSTHVVANERQTTVLNSKVNKHMVQNQRSAHSLVLQEAGTSGRDHPDVCVLPVPPTMEGQDVGGTYDYYQSLHLASPYTRELLQQASRNESSNHITTFNVQLNEPPQPSGKHKDYYANVGDAIRTLRDDIPMLFVRELNWEIYRDDVVFRDPNISFKGLDNYKLIFWSLRFHGRLFFKKLFVEVVRIWQPEDHQIKMRWKVHAYPRVWWETEGTFDGISTYKLDKEGRIYEHSVDNVQLRDPPITNPLLYGLNFLMQPRLQPQGQMPCPGSYFRGSMDMDDSSLIVDGGSS